MNVQGKKISILGAARSGVAVAQLLQQRGARVFVSDKAPRENMDAAARELEAKGIATEFGENSNRVLDADIIVISPGVPSDAPIVKDAVAKNIRILSELEVAGWFHHGPIVAITGTNGKTTTTALTGRIFSDAHVPSVVAGNIGTAFSQVVQEMEQVAILEVSSFQLDHVEAFRPRVSVLLNITPDHLDRYEHSFDKYAAAKCRVFARQGEGDTLVFNRDDAITARLVEEQAPPAVRLLSFGMTEHGSDGTWLQEGKLMVRMGGTSAQMLPAGEISIRGEHNLYNAMAATLAAKTLGVGDASLRATLRNFKGVEHRLEFVRELDGVTYINDSKATNVDSVWYALRSFDAPIIIMLGGRDKGNDYGRLHELVRRSVKEVIAIGESADKVVRSFQAITRVTRARTMEEAVTVSAEHAMPGDVVLLSPACASFDWFDNYEHRGKVFKELVMHL
jgi:UDP-N-acetylmuramoylalanine--D-glutamate ligase